MGSRGILIWVSVGLCGLVLWLFMVNLYEMLVLKPKRIRSKLEKQGIKGPSPSSFFYGNIPEINQICALGIRSSSPPPATTVPSHDWATKVFPHFHLWANQYGKTFLYSTGSIQTLCITDPELVKELSLHTSLNLGKPSYLSKDRGPLLGRGILSSNGTYWSHQRKIIAPQFFPDKVKDMVTLMANSTMTTLEIWERRVVNARKGYAEIRVDDDLRSLSADIISRACFGSDYNRGEMIFRKLRTIQKIMSKASVGIPGSRYLPTKDNREIWRLENEINLMILGIVNAHREATNERNLLQSIVEAAKKHGENGIKWMEFGPSRFITDNCKNIYFAGHETTATSASWCLMLLAAHPEWQARARSEVLEVCGDKHPDANMLQSMKMLTMVILEGLRLYPPVSFVVREALQDVRLKDIRIPKGVDIKVPIPIMHQNPDLWGPDVHRFNPERFAEGSKVACRAPHVYMPFGTGARVCAGQHFAIVELKVILSLILSRFSVSLSPTYQHSPMFGLTIEPKHGIYLNVKRV